MAAQPSKTARIYDGAEPAPQLDRRRIAGEDDRAIGRRARLLHLAVGLTGIAIYFLLKGAAQDSLYDLFGLSSVAALLFGITRYRPEHPLPWYLFALASSTSTAGDITYNLYENLWHLPAPFPSMADAFYLASYPIFAVGLVLLIRGRERGRDWTALLDAAIITLGMGIVSWVFLMSPYAADYSAPLVNRLISIAYPLMDVLWLGLAARLLFVPGARTPAYWFLLASVICRMVADSGYAAMVLAGTYHSGVPIDAGWMLHYLFVGAAALHPTMRSIGETAPLVESRPSRLRLVLLAGASVLPLGVFTLQALRGAPIHVPVIIGGSVVLFLLVFVRMAGLLSKHQQSLDRERIISRNGATLLAAVDRETIYAAALDTARSLVQGRAFSSICVVVGSPESMKVVASAGEQAGSARGRSLTIADLPPPLRADVLAGRPAVVEQTTTDALRRVVDPESSAREIFVMPLPIRRELGGAIVVAAYEPLPEEVHESLRSLGSQLALTLERAALTEDLHRRQSEARFRSLVQNAQDIITIVDADGTISYQSPSVERVLGFKPDALIGTDLFALIHPDDVAGARAFRSALLESPGASPVAEVRVRHRDGSWRDIEQVGSNLLDDPTVGGLVINLRDVTERKKLDRIKSEFISTVSHELRTPLTSIRGSLGLIAGGVAGTLPPQASSLIDIAYKNSERLVRLINDILDIEKLESGKMHLNLQRIELLPLVEQALEANRDYAAQFGVTFVLEQPAPGIIVRADGDRLMQVLANLLSNAAKFSPPGGVVGVTMSSRAGAIRVAVTDRGPGIPKEFWPRIFQKFAQADTSDTRQKGGTGLGLSISKAIVEKHGGQIGFTTGDAGTTFYFELPTLEPARAAPSTGQHTGNGQRILICEDDQDVATLLAMLLRQEGFEIDTAHDAAQARQLLATRSYDAMTLDLLLPDEDGVAFIHKLRADHSASELPILVVSAVAGQGREIVNGASLGVIDWMSKPIDTSRLIHAIRQAVETTGEEEPLRILHVEDDPDIVKVVSLLLQDYAQITDVATLADARRLITEQEFDLIILDVGLQDGSGLDLLPILNRPNSQAIPVLVFSAHELGQNVAGEVAGTLVKTRTSNEELVRTVKSLIAAGQRSERTVATLQGEK